MTTATAVLEVQKRYGSRALMLAIGSGLLFLVLGYKEICRGVVLGGLFSAINFVLMGQLLRHRLAATRKAAAGRSLVFLLLRHLLLAIPLVLAVQSERFSFGATAVGVLMVQIVILIEHGQQLFKTVVRH